MSSKKRDAVEVTGRHVVILQKPHTHAGIDCSPGDRIEVDAPTQAWLISQGVIEQPELN